MNNYSRFQSILTLDNLPINVVKQFDSYIRGLGYSSYESRFAFRFIIRGLFLLFTFFTAWQFLNFPDSENRLMQFFNEMSGNFSRELFSVSVLNVN